MLEIQEYSEEGEGTVATCCLSVGKSVVVQVSMALEASNMAHVCCSLPDTCVYMFYEASPLSYLWSTRPQLLIGPFLMAYWLLIQQKSLSLPFQLPLCLTEPATSQLPSITTRQ